ncbi:MAG: DUF2237 family protein, partial [Burkholderiaceae bacterium]|nr:DUF2237 family protein [Burkholderiaceae bacterium]
RWQEALANGCAPLIKLESTHINALDHVDFDTLKLFALENQSEL